MIFLVVYFQNSCCPFTNVTVFMNTGKMALLIHAKGDLHLCHFEFPKIDIFSCKTYCTLAVLVNIHEKESEHEIGSTVSMSSIVPISTLATIQHSAPLSNN